MLFYKMNFAKCKGHKMKNPEKFLNNYFFKGWNEVVQYGITKFLEPISLKQTEKILEQMNNSIVE